MQIKNLNYIDSLRGLAIILVLVVHSTMLLSLTDIHLPESIQTLLGFGQFGVVLFFLVSAYTLFRSLDLRKESNIKYFFLRRFFRIAPLYYLILGIAFFTSFGVSEYLGDGVASISLTNLLSHIFFVNRFGATTFNSILGVEWTIFVEIWFYLLLPFIYIYKRYINQIFLSFLGVMLLTFIYLKTLQIDGLAFIAIYKSPLIQFLPFFIGCYIYIYDDVPFINTFFIKYKYLILSFIIMTCVFFSYYTSPFIFVIMTGLFSLFFLLVKNARMLIFDNRLLQSVGKISYSLYLIHFFVLTAIINNQQQMFFKDYPIVVVYLIFLFITISLSIVSYNLVEVQFIKMGKNLIDSLQKGASH